MRKVCESICISTVSIPKASLQEKKSDEMEVDRYETQ